MPTAREKEVPARYRIPCEVLVIRSGLSISNAKSVCLLRESMNPEMGATLWVVLCILRGGWLMRMSL